jgi:transposase-like protein
MMIGTWKQYEAADKAKAALEVFKGEETIVQIAEEIKIHESHILRKVWTPRCSSTQRG